MQNEVRISKSAEETQEFAKQIAKQLKPGDILTLSGVLGSGKTTFVQGLAKGLGVTQNIISPTFIIVRQYEVDKRSQESEIKRFYHIDLYRIEDKKDLRGLGLEDVLHDNESIVAIEWPEKIGRLFPKKRINISFRHMDDTKRQIAIKTYE